MGKTGITYSNPPIFISSLSSYNESLLLKVYRHGFHELMILLLIVIVSKEGVIYELFNLQVTAMIISICFLT